MKNIIIRSLKALPIGDMLLKSIKIKRRRLFAFANGIQYPKFAQIRNDTSEDRYPAIFQHLMKEASINERSELKILSFGCSTGEECSSLRKYFPSALIVGLDINTKNIEIARKKNLDDKIVFFSDLEDIKQYGEFGIVIAMSVLCRWPDSSGINNISGIFSYKTFNKMLEMINEFVAKSGYLIIYNANFRFTDTQISNHYSKISIPNYSDSGFVTKFSASNKILSEQFYPYSMFIKRQ
jgi:hypothetical protein